MQIIDELTKRYQTTQAPFIQAVQEVISSLEEVINSDSRYLQEGIIERLIIPDREISFRIDWIDDNGKIQINHGYRIQFNNALGPYKGGLRFHPSVNRGILKFLGFEQIFKNSLTGLAMGGAKGGSDFDPKGKSDREIMRFCQSFMRELYRHIGDRIDVPAGDIGVGSREIGYLYGEYKRLTQSVEGVLTGKPLGLGGSLVRPEATGYGVVYFAQKMVQEQKNETLKGKICTVSGAGNVALHTIEKLHHIGAIPVSCSDSQGVLYDPKGIDIDYLKEIKLVQHQPLESYRIKHPDAIFQTPLSQEGKNVWKIPTFAAFACATQNEIDLNDAKNLIQNGCKAVIEGANMPSSPEAIELFSHHSIMFAPAKAANAGGVSVSQFEMSQNASMAHLPFDNVDRMLQQTMENIYNNVSKTAIHYGENNNLSKGANIAGFIKVAQAMIDQGV
jgi:glutamate dehydrogenase (NADP+)